MSVAVLKIVELVPMVEWLQQEVLVWAVALFVQLVSLPSHLPQSAYHAILERMHLLLAKASAPGAVMVCILIQQATARQRLAKSAIQDSTTIWLGLLHASNVLQVRRTCFLLPLLWTDV
jgi:hypothetical protein